jgi:hypothetical protein
MTGFPLLAHELTSYPEFLDEPRKVYPQSGTALEMAALLRADYDQEG